MYKLVEREDENLSIMAMCRDIAEDYWVMNIQMESHDSEVMENFMEWLYSSNGRGWGITFRNGAEGEEDESWADRVQYKEEGDDE